MKKVTIVFGSPRKNSNTHILVDQAIAGLKEKGVDHEIFYLNDMNIRGCQACYYCKRNDTTKCVVDDDMQKIYRSMEETDGLIIATPIYFCEVSSQTRAFVDRLYPYYDSDLVPDFPKGKKVGFIVTQFRSDREVFKPQIDTFKMVIGLLGYEKTGDLLVENLDKGYRPMVSEYPNIMKEAYKLGFNLLG